MAAKIYGFKTKEKLIMSDCYLTSIFQLYQEQVTFDKIMMMSAVYYTNLFDLSMLAY